MERRDWVGDDDLPFGLATRSTLAESVYDTIRAAILQGRFEPGERLSIDALARRLGVSLTPVREALNRLAAEGIASYRSMVGYSVTSPLSAAEYDHLMEARFVLEPEIAALAAQRISPGLLAELRTRAEVSTSSDVESEYERFRHRTELDQEFHRFLAQVSENVFLRNALESLRAHLHIYRLFDPTAADSRTTSEHLRIVDAVVAGDPAAARDAMTRHLDGSYHRHAAGLGHAIDGSDGDDSAPPSAPGTGNPGKGRGTS